MEINLTEKLKSSPFVRELAYSWKEWRNSERGINSQLSIREQGKYDSLLETIENTKVNSYKNPNVPTDTQITEDVSSF